MNILIIGATSRILEETARCFALQKERLFLVARTKDKLDIIVEDLRARGAEVCGARVWNTSHSLEDTRTMMMEAYEKLGFIDAALVGPGFMPDQADMLKDVKMLDESFVTNALGIVHVLMVAREMALQKQCGMIAAISSVAGDRGRAAHYVYGSAKAALSHFLQGLRGELLSHRVPVLTIKPGFVDTPMTAHIRKSFLFASPERVGRVICRALTQKKSGTLYVPWFWYYIMFVLRALPEAIFLRLKI